jgi:hypothetical protein
MNLKKQWSTATPLYAKTQTIYTCHDNTGEFNSQCSKIFKNKSVTKNLSTHLEAHILAELTSCKAGHLPVLFNQH